MSETHRFPTQIYWEDTEAAGIVYYANYLRFLERDRSDLVRGAGIDQGALLDSEGVVFPVRRCEIDYLQPARLDNQIEVRTRIQKIRRRQHGYGSGYPSGRRTHCPGQGPTGLRWAEWSATAPSGPYPRCPQ